MNIQMPRRWQKFVDIWWSHWCWGLLWSRVDGVFLTVSLRNPLWHSRTLSDTQLLWSLYIIVSLWCQVSFIPPPVRQISWGRFTYWAVFFIQSKVAAWLLPPADIQGGREGGWSSQHYGCWYSTKYTINLGSPHSRALCRYLENLHFLMSCTLLAS